MIPRDAVKAEYLVVIVHSEYEKTVLAFVSLEKAKEEFRHWADMSAEVYLASILADENSSK